MRVEAAPLLRGAAWSAVAALVLVVLLGLANDAAGEDLRPLAPLGWLALGATAAAMASGLWDDRSRDPLAGLYLIGLCACGWTVHQFHLSAGWLIWTGTMVLAAYAVATSFLWSRRSALADRLGMPPGRYDDPHRHLTWLVPANLALTTLVVTLAVGTILTEPDAVRRSSAAHAALAGALAVGLLARGERRSTLQRLALGVGVVGAVAWGWAWITPGAATVLLDRLAVVLVALMVAEVLYGLGLAKLFPRTTEWTRAARRLVPGLLAAAGLALALTLAVELRDRSLGGDVAMSAPAVAAVVAVLAGAVVAALVAALVPGGDPLGLPERRRTLYVYGSEALLAAIVLHARLALPWLFTPFFARYWPLILLGVAFLGVGLSELFRRQGRRVLAEPLERTGAFLPALPLLAALWIGPKPGDDVVFLVLAGGLYAALALLRSSTIFGALAALACNAAIWIVLGRWDGLGLAEHPQLWAIPPALCVLAGAL